MKLSTSIIGGWVIASLALASGAPAAETPSIDSILAKYVEARGGKVALEKIKSRLIKIKVESESFGTSEGEICAKAPNKLTSHIEASGSGAIDDGFDGTVAWSKNPWAGLRVKSGDELVRAKGEAEFYRDLKLKALYPDLTVKGTEKVGDEEAYVLEAKPTASSKEKYWISVKSGLGLRLDSQFEGPQGTIAVSTWPQDYKMVEGIKYPGKIKIKFTAGDQTMEFTLIYLEIKHNTPIDDAKFAKPSA